MEKKRIMAVRRGMWSISLLAVLSLVAACAKAAPTSITSQTPKPSSTSTAAVTTSKTTAPTSTTSQAPKPSTTSATTTTTLKFAEVGPSGNTGRASAYIWWADEINKRTNGRVKIQFYWSASLVPVKEALRAVSTGVAETAAVILPYQVAELPLAQIGGLPAMVSDTRAAHLAADELYRTEPAMKGEFDKWNQVVLSVGGSPGTNYLLTTKPVKTLAELKGMTISTLGAYYPRLMGDLGAVSVTLTSDEIYDALSKGVAQGRTAGLETIYRYSYHDVAKYIYKLNLGTITPGSIITINRDVWNKLPADVQKVIQQASDELLNRLIDTYLKEEGQYETQLLQKGVQMFEATPADKDKVVALSKPMWDKWVQDLEAKGLPARKVLTEYADLYNKYLKK